ncbi:MAG: hypothetical protein IKY43_03610, partial [Bacteroidales bacterium]|nr:hypothetical protein [Bacteroidales bacterium]
GMHFLRNEIFHAGESIAHHCKDLEGCTGGWGDFKTYKANDGSIQSKSIRRNGQKLIRVERLKYYNEQKRKKNDKDNKFYYIVLFYETMWYYSFLHVFFCFISLQNYILFSIYNN